MNSLTDLPFDVIQLIAALLLPYDVLALSKTCRKLHPLLCERTVWLQIADSISLSRPLPFTAAQALDLPIEELVETCLRAERIAKRWARRDIHSRVKPIRISFPDKRMITYFTFLPGTRHLMICDVHNNLSCWTTDGQLLESWQIARDAKLTRWKPCDESESNYEFGDRHLQAVEIMIEMPRRARSTRYEIILLVYAGSFARFVTIGDFSIPRHYEPFSSMTQDELRGSLVGIISSPHDRVGIYLIDKNTEKAICIDTGLLLIVDSVPQALLSSSHVVLYWETLTAAHTIAYDMDTLRATLARDGRTQDDEMLIFPVPVAPSEVLTIPFRTVSASFIEDNASPRSTHTCQGCGSRIEDAMPNTDLSNNRDAYPVIIPKWHTLREDLRRHRTRSILTFSRCPQHYQGLASYINAQSLGAIQMYELNGGVGPDFSNGVPVANNNGFAPPIDLFENGDHYIGSYPRTTITHHYFNFVRSTSGSRVSELVRTVLTEAPLRRPQSIRIPREYPHPVLTDAAIDYDDDDDDNDDLELVGLGEAFGGYQNANDDTHASEHGGDVDILGLGLENLGGLSEEQEIIAQTGDTLQHGQEHSGEHGNGNDLDQSTEHDDQGNGFDEVIALGNNIAGLGLEMGDLENDAPEHMFGGPTIVSLEEDAAQALDEFAQEPFGGSPVMGYGGRCAMWVEEYPSKRGPNHRSPVLRVATFPSYEPDPEPLHGAEKRPEYVHPELEVARGRVGTLHLPQNIYLEGAYTFDLDDIRGVVGLATSRGELWLVDFS